MTLVYTFLAIGLLAYGQMHPGLVVGGICLIGFIGWKNSTDYQRTNFDWPLRLFLISGLVGLAVSPNIWPGLAKLGLILCGIFLYYYLQKQAISYRVCFAAGLFSFVAGVAVWYVIQSALVVTNFPARPGFLNLYQNYHNEIAGILEIGLLVGIGFALSLRRLPLPVFSMLTPWLISSRRYLRHACGGTLFIIILALLATGSRGAWLTMLLLGAGWWLTQYRPKLWSLLQANKTILIPGAILMVAVILFLSAATYSRFDLRLFQLLAWAETDLTRLTLYFQAGQLAIEYLFTGLGLNAFPMAYSAYILQIDVIYLYHAHNLYLNIWLEQGLMGLIAFVWLGLITLNYPPTIDKNDQANDGTSDWVIVNRSLVLQCRLAILAIFLHGLFDSTHYNSPFLPLIFIVFGLIGQPGQSLNEAPFRPVPPFRSFYRARPWSVFVIFLLLVLSFHQPIFGHWYSNIGAVTQTKIELHAYRWPDQIPTKVRATADMSLPIFLFRKSLAYNPHHTIALKRLSLIEGEHEPF